MSFVDKLRKHFSELAKTQSPTAGDINYLLAILSAQNEQNKAAETYIDFVLADVWRVPALKEEPLLEAWQTSKKNTLRIINEEI